MSGSQRPSEFQAALDFVMLKTQLQRLGVIGGGYGLLACSYGLPKNHLNLYLVHILLGTVLMVAGILSYARPKPIYLLVQGGLLVAMGVWIEVMAKLGEAAGGSPTLFAIWGIVMAFVGTSEMFGYSQFAYLNEQSPSKAEVSAAGIIIKKLLSANARKEPDVIFMRVGPHPDQPEDLQPDTWHVVPESADQWKARLLPDAVVLLNHRRLRALALCRADFGVRTACPEMPMGYSVRILGVTYIVGIEQRYTPRLTEWLSSNLPGSKGMNLVEASPADGEDNS